MGIAFLKCWACHRDCGGGVICIAYNFRPIGSHESIKRDSLSELYSSLIFAFSGERKAATTTQYTYKFC